MSNQLLKSNIIKVNQNINLLLDASNKTISEVEQVHSNNKLNLIYQDIDICVKPYYKSRLKLFKALVGNTVTDALLYMPTSNIEKFEIEELSREYINKQVIVNVTIDNIEIPRYSSNKPIVILGHVGNNSIELLFFNYKPAYLKGTFYIGCKVQLTGQLTVSSLSNYQMINPKKANFKTIPGVYNVYPLKNGVNQDCIYSITEKA